jgi:hypothetical protein
MQAMRKSGASVKDSRFDHPPYVPEDNKPIDASGVVDPSALAVDPDNKNFIPANKDELKLAVQTMLSDIDNLEIPRTYLLIKKSIDKMREEQKMENLSTVDESIIRRAIRKILNEAPSILDSQLTSIDKYTNDPEIVDLVLSFKPSSDKAEASEDVKKKKLVNLQKQVERKLKSKGLRADVDMMAAQVMDKILDPRNAAARETYLQSREVTKLDPSMSNAYGPGDPRWESEVKSLRSLLQTMSFDDTEKGTKKEMDAGINLAALRIIKNPTDNPINLVKKTARWLKDNVSGDIGENLLLVIQSVIELAKDSNNKEVKKAGMEMLAAIKAQPGLVPSEKKSKLGDESRDEIAKAIGVKYGTNVRGIEEEALQKFKERISPDSTITDVELKDNVQIAVMYALKDFLSVIPSADLYSKEDIEVFKASPDIATELPIFRVFLNGYLDELDVDEFVDDPNNVSIKSAASKSGLKALKGEIKKVFKNEPAELTPALTTNYN